MCAIIFCILRIYFLNVKIKHPFYIVLENSFIALKTCLMGFLMSFIHSKQHILLSFFNVG